MKALFVSVFCPGNRRAGKRRLRALLRIGLQEVTSTDAAFRDPPEGTPVCGPVLSGRITLMIHVPAGNRMNEYIPHDGIR